MQGFACRYHGEDVFVRLDFALHQDRPRVVVLEELLHLRRQLLQRFTADSVHAHGFGQGDKVWIPHRGVRVPVVVEKI